MSGRDVFFETIGPAHRPLVQWFLARGDRVFVFDFTYRMRRQAWLRRLFDEGAVTRIWIGPGRAASEAIAAADVLWTSFEDHPLARALARVYGAAEARPVLTWALLVGVFRVYCMRQWLALHRTGEGRGRRVLLVPQAFMAWRRILRSHPSLAFEFAEAVKVPWIPRVWSVAAGCGEATLRRWRECARNAVRIALTWWGRRTSPAPVEPTLRVRHVYAVDQPFQVKFASGRGVDFLLDGVRISPSNTAFVVHPSAEGSWIDRARAVGHHVVRRREAAGRQALVARPARTPDLGALARVVALAAFRLDAPAWLAEAANVGVTVAITEAMVLERVAFENYVYTNQEDLVRRWQNVITRRFGGRSWNFMASMSAGYVQGPDTDHWLWAYQNCDHFVGQSHQMVAYQEGQRQVVGAYHSVGNIWSEGIDAAAGERARREWFGDQARDAKVVAWFDTTFIEAENSPSTFGDAVEFYTEAERLLEEDPKLWMVVKPSKEAQYFTDIGFQWYHPLGRTVVECWERLRRHPRARFVGHDTDPAVVIAASDVTVTCTLSSPTAEALGARRRAFWYDPAQRWKGTLYDVHPLLLAHGPHELRASLRQLLYTMTDAEYNAFLDEHVCGLVEDFLDGKGLTRVRALLDETPAGGRGVDAAR